MTKITKPETKDQSSSTSTMGPGPEPANNPAVNENNASEYVTLIIGDYITIFGVACSGLEKARETEKWLDQLLDRMLGDVDLEVISLGTLIATPHLQDLLEQIGRSIHGEGLLQGNISHLRIIEPRDAT